MMLSITSLQSSEIQYCFAVDPVNPYSWSEQEIAELHNFTTVILAADGKKIQLDTLQKTQGFSDCLKAHSLFWSTSGPILQLKTGLTEGWVEIVEHKLCVA